MPKESSSSSPSSSDRTPSNLIDLNSQLIAQGITKFNLKLDGLSSRHRDNVVGVLRGLLQKRTEDLDRTESISTAHRVLSYDHERLCSMHKKLKGRVIGAEKEREMIKAQMSDLAGKLKLEEAAHKYSKEEAQKSRTALAYVRTQAQHDAKKKDAQLEKSLQQWQRLSNENTRVPTATSRGGMVLLNPVAHNEPGPRADSFWDPAVKELNTTIVDLQEECEAFRHVTLSAANQLQAILALASTEPEPPRLQPSAFFSSHQTLNTSSISSSTSHPLSADHKLKDLLSKLRGRIEREVNEKRDTARMYQSELDLDLMEGEGERVERVKGMMRGRMGDLEVQLAESKRAAEEAQKLLLDFAKSTGKSVPQLRFALPAEDGADDEEENAEAGPSSLAKASEVDVLKEELEEEKEAVEAERRRMTEGLVRLAQERAVFEQERAAYLEEKRARELAELLREPDKPSPGSSDTSASSASPSEQSGNLSTPSKSNSSITKQDTAKYPPTSAHRLLTPPRPTHLLKNRPSISSPLAGGGQRTIPATPPKAASPALRKRSRKGPSTPLARYVSHKIVAEKLASAKKMKMTRVEAEDEGVGQDNGEVEAEEAQSSTREAEEAQSSTRKSAESTTAAGPSALTASSKANPTLGAGRPPPALTAKDRLAAIKSGSRARVVSPSKPSSKATPMARGGYLSSTAASAQRKGMLGSQPGKKLEIGQASGMGPASAARKPSPTVR